jgi:hypothetical protein
VKRNLVISGIVSIAVGAILYMLGGTYVVLGLGTGTMSVYPAAFFVILGLVLLYRSMKR